MRNRREVFCGSDGKNWILANFVEEVGDHLKVISALPQKTMAWYLNGFRRSFQRLR